jgi:hypothetical protein
MNYIQELREQLITNNNTAQQQLQTILETTVKQVERIDIKESLHGDIDLSIIREMGLGNVKEIVFFQGEITSIRNIPSGITLLSCEHNLLIELSDMPNTLTTLEIDHNHITEIDVSYLKNLKTLHVSHNKIKVIENLPESLVELECTNNHLQRIDLYGATEIKKLHISNNSITLLENMPDSISDFQMENTPLVEFRNSENIPLTSKQSDEEKNEADARKNYDESLRTYFNLKNNYEKQLSKMKKKAHISATTKKMAKQAVMSIKPKCVKCNRPVGTVFAIKDNTYTAICGDTANPCSLNIKLFNGEVRNVDYLLADSKQFADDSKNVIIKQKMDNLFGYISEDAVAKTFDNHLQDFVVNNEMFTSLSEKRNDVYFDEKTSLMVTKKREQLYRLVEKLRMTISEYKLTNNYELLRTAVDLQKTEIYPEVRNLRNLQHELMGMIYKEKTNEHILYQNAKALNKYDSYYEEPMVQNFVL